MVAQFQAEIYRCVTMLYQRDVVVFAKELLFFSDNLRLCPEEKVASLYVKNHDT